MERQRHKRIVVETPSGRSPRGSGRQAAPRPRESIVAVTVIAAATLATFLALFVTSRLMIDGFTIAPQQTVPQGQHANPFTEAITDNDARYPGAVIRTSKRVAGETKVAAIDDATIQAANRKDNRRRFDTFYT